MGEDCTGGLGPEVGVVVEAATTAERDQPGVAVLGEPFGVEAVGQGEGEDLAVEHGDGPGGPAGGGLLAGDVAVAAENRRAGVDREDSWCDRVGQGEAGLADRCEAVGYAESSGG